MSLMLVASQENVSLSSKIRRRVAEGASVWELSPAAMPAYLAAAVGSAAVEAVFVSDKAAVAVLPGGKRVVRKAPQA